MAKLKFFIEKPEELDLSLIHKPLLLSDAEEWNLQVYRQFGFEDYEELQAFALKYKNFEWMTFFYWSEEVEQAFLKHIISLYGNISKRKQKQIAEYYTEASLNWFPTNELEPCKKKHEDWKKLNKIEVNI